MANLKLDLLNKLNNDKFYEETELVRLAQEPNMNYKKKVEDMASILHNIAILNSQIALVGQYFQEPAPVSQPVAQNQPVPGQSHVE